MSIHDLLKILKSRNINIDTLTRQQVLDAGYGGNCGISLVISDVKRAHDYQQNPPKRRVKRTTKRKRTRKADTGRRKKQSASTVFLSQLQAAATLELIDRVNGEDETEAEGNPLQLLNTQPGEPFPTLLVIHPGETPADVLADLAANLPDTGYRMTDHEERQPW